MGKPEELEFAKLLFGGVALMFLLALTIILFMTVYQRRLYTQQKKILQIELNYQKNLLESTVQSQENERERIAQDLHDEIGASLSVAKLFINQIQYETSPADMKDLAKQSSQIIGNIVQDIRQIAHNLSPLTLENLGLTVAIKTLLNQLETAGLTIDCLLDLPSDSLSMRQQLTLYRIIQEALGNSIKHAAATQLTVHLEQQGPLVRLHIEDNGKGFDLQAKKPKRTGMGMDTIKARAGVLNAALEIRSSVGQGTCLTMTIPIDITEPLAV